MNRTLGIAVAAVGAAAVIAGVVLLGGDGSGDAPRPGATLSSSHAAPEAPPAFAAPGAEAAPAAVAPLASAPSELPASPGAAAVAPAKAARPAGAEVSVTGRVVDESGRAVPGARVSFASDPFPFAFGRSGFARGLPAQPELPHAETDRAGRFTLQGTLPPPAESEGLPLPEAQPQLIVQHDAFASLVHACSAIAAPRHDAGDLVLSAGAWITGRAVDEAGRPLAGAHVTAQNVDDERRPRGPFGMGLFGGIAEALDAATTGADGRFRVAGLLPGKADLTVRADGRRLASVEDVALTAQTPADVGDIALAVGQSIGGVVLDEAGRALPEAEVSLSSMARLVVNRLEDLPRGQIGQEFGQRATTDGSGRFEISGLAGGHYTVHVSAKGFERLSREDVPAGTHDLRLSPIRLGGLFVAVVNDSDGAPVAGALIKATPVASEGPFGRFSEDRLLPVLTGADALAAAGRSGDAPGAYFVQEAPREGTNLVVAAEGFATLEVSGPPVESSAVGSTTVRLVPESVVSGTVARADGTPIGDAHITLSVARPDDSDEDEPFRGGRRGFMRSLRVGEPDAHAAAAELDAERLTTRTHADGSFELHGVAPGDWELSATHPDHVDGPVLPLSLAKGQSQRDLQLTLEPAGAIVGHVTEADGLPAADIEITVTPADEARAAPSETEDVTVSIGRMLQIDDGTGRRYARTEPDGSYRVGGLPAGEYQVALGGGARRGRRMGGGMMFALAGDRGEPQQGPSIWTKVVPGAEQPVDFVRPRRGTITGRVVAGGRPVPDLPVSLRAAPRPGAFSFPGMGGEEARTDDRGAFRFDEVEAGEYELSAHVPGSALDRTAAVKLDAGEARSADLVFGGSTLSGRVVDRGSDAGAPGVSLTVVPVEDAAASADAPRMTMAFVIAGDGPGGGGMSMEIGGGPAQQVKSGADGAFELLYVDPGSYRIEASGGGYTGGDLGPFDVADGQDKDDLRIDVEKGAVVHGTVVSGQTGERLDAVPVRIESTDSRQMTVTENGKFRFEGLSPGKYTVSVLGSGFGSQFGEDSALASEDVELEIGQVRELDLKTKT